MATKLPSGRTVIVTGASAGIGAGIARRLVSDGYHVVGTYHRGKERIQELAREIPGLAVAQLDTGSPDSINTFVASLAGQEIFALVNNAGIVEFEEVGVFDAALWRRVQDVNVQGALALSLALRAQFSSPAAIVNIASTDAFMGGVDTMAYAASKAALISVTKSLALNLGPSIRVNAIAPGWIDTEMGTKLPQMVIEHTAVGRLGTPADIAGIVAFLVSNDAAYVTGATIVADGGYYCLDPVMKAEKLLSDKGRDV
jgi:NAD(P)-dependent dehydrogenase (short-subunit alcohol dehydrogenase family)